MLTTKQRAIVKSTVPLLESGGEALTTHFYKMLLAEHPEVRPFFNQANQASGEQPRALANGVLMYARHIDDMDKLNGLVSRIINKHVSLQIQPEHYPIIGGCLLRAIRDVLGADIATDDVLAAWSAAYDQLANKLAGAEEQIYAENAAVQGGWRGARPFVVKRKMAESDEITSFYLQAEDGGGVASFKPGQFIGIKLVVNGEEIRRNYSLSAAPSGHEYRISVKRQPGGIASGFLHAQVNEGDVVELFPPAGDFVLEDNAKPLVLLSGGIGITPTLAMLDEALLGKRPVHFIHFARNRAVHAFRGVLAARQASHPQLQHFFVYDEHPDDARSGPAAPHAIGRLSNEQLRRWLPASLDIEAYFLGPKAFMRQIKRQLRELGVPASQTHFEFFGPASALE